jgi:hypothetical protein
MIHKPFNTSLTVVVSAKISRKYSGGVLRGSILAGLYGIKEICLSTTESALLLLLKEQAISIKI